MAHSSMAKGSCLLARIDIGAIPEKGQIALRREEAKMGCPEVCEYVGFSNSYCLAS
jgi:hypothetical protein